MQTFEQQYREQVYTVDVDDRILTADYPMIARAVKLVREKLAFRGGVVVGGLRPRLAGQYSPRTGVITFASYVAQKDWKYVIEIAVHEAIHALGVHHQDNFRSHGGSRCGHGRDTLTHCVTEIITGMETFANMKFLHQHIGAFSKKLLRQVAMVEAILWTQHKIPEALGNCRIADLTDSRMYSWQQKSAHEKAMVVAKRTITRWEHEGYEISPMKKQEMIEQQARLLEYRYR